MENAERKGQLNRVTLRWLWDAAAGKKRCVAGLLGLQVVINTCIVGYSLLFREIVDRAVAGDRPGFISSILTLACLAAFQIAMRAAFRALDEYTRAKMENSVKARLFGILLRRDYAAVTAVHTGEWMNRLTSDTVVVANGITQILPNVGGMIVRMVGVVAAIMVLEPRFGLLLIPAGLALLVVTRVFRPMLKRLHSRIQEADGGVRVLLQERLDNLLIVRAFSQQEKSEELARQEMDRHQAARMKRNHMSNLSSVGFGVAIQGMYLLAAFVCGSGILDGTATFGTLTAVLQLVSQLQLPLSGFSGYLTQWYGMTASAERLMEAEKFPADGEAADPAASLAYYEDAFSGIRVEKLCFSYESEDRQVAVRDLDIQVEKGQFVALAGRSGCGKSTLLKLLMCLYCPDSGELRLLDRSGSRPLTAGDRGLFAYVPQGNQLMSGTIRQILAFYDENGMDREAALWEALEIACAREFVEALPQGLDTLLGEHGCGLSEGQIQRIAVARAIFSRRPILLLDESTSALDEATESRLLDNLRTMTDRTVLIVTHRPRACQVCDRVVRLDREATDTEDKG